MKPADHAHALGVLRQARWLQGYAPTLAEALLAEGRLVRRAAGEWAQAEGDDRGGLFVVIAGVLHSYCAAPGDREVMIGLAEAGAVLGHATRFSGGPRLVTAVCVEPCILLELIEPDKATREAELERLLDEFGLARLRASPAMALS
ncbi:cyclic nucleotide-binding domain-containing protein, partial [Novosphingobium sp.]|uniref:Crp/Fnr family transcriptional regulator n=1 Tax=Novosphingobium sp. TaxID=1874826 RepID=UPI002584307F